MHHDNINLVQAEYHFITANCQIELDISLHDRLTPLLSSPFGCNISNNVCEAEELENDIDTIPVLNCVISRLDLKLR